MTVSMYQASVPVLLRGLERLAFVVDKGAAHAASHKIDPAVLASARLYPNMLPLIKQVQIASDTSKGAGARLAGVEVPKFADTETTFPELAERIQKTIDFLKTLKPEQFEGAESRKVSLPMGPNKTVDFTGQSYLFGFTLPNFFFHVVTAYNILRHNGVELGKMDYLGGF